MGERLGGRTIYVTGSSGIADAGARRFALDGAVVGVIARDADECEALAGSIVEAGGRAAWSVADLRDEGATTAAFAALRAAIGPPDGLFAVAGGSGRRFGDGPIHEASLEGWRETLDLNGVPTFLAAREAVRAMLPPGGHGGSIVIVTSVLASDPVPDLFATHAYAAIKGAQDALARTMAATYAPHGIRVNALAPGLVATPMSARAQGDETTTAYIARKQPLAGGFLTAASIADVAAFLLSDEAAQVTGQRIAVDGGWSVTEAGA